jgi:hypothetical protein
MFPNSFFTQKNINNYLHCSSARRSLKKTGFTAKSEIDNDDLKILLEGTVVFLALRNAQLANLQ